MPGINNWDFAVVKETRVLEKKAIQFQAEFLNGWNHTQYGAPATGLNPSTFGTISSLPVPARQIQFGLKFLWEIPS
jgi:hypothetical protein